MVMLMLCQGCQGVNTKMIDCPDCHNLCSNEDCSNQQAPESLSVFMVGQNQGSSAECNWIDKWSLEDSREFQTDDKFINFVSGKTS